MGWRASETTVRVKCPVPDCPTRGDAAENALLQNAAPMRFVAACSVHDAPLIKDSGVAVVRAGEEVSK